MRAHLAVATALVVVGLISPAAAAAHDGDGLEIDALLDEGVGQPTFNESYGCGQPSTTNPLATKIGWLSDAELVRGYKSALLGRSIGAIRDQLVNWVVPMSGGHAVKVHARALPAFRLVAANLAAEAARGNFYAVRSQHTFGHHARTVAGRHSMSNHAFGTAVDINSTSNPYRADNVLVTDLPAWFVKAWTDAGFCWGGDWVNIKDPMHFSWKGPASTPGYGAWPDAHPVATAAAAFTDVAATFLLPYGELDPDRSYVVTDATGNGLADVYQVSQQGYGIQLDYSRTHRLQRWCAVGRVAVEDIDLDGRLVLFGDYEGFGRTDLWLADVSSGSMEIEIVLRSSDFVDATTIATGIVPSPDDVYLVADHDGDGVVDLLVLRRTAVATHLEVWDGAAGYTARALTVTTPLGDTRAAHFAIGDRNLDGAPDLYVAAAGTLSILANGYTAVTSSLPLAVPADLRDLAVSDYDGDGRDDLFLLADSGQLTVRLGNSRLPGATLTSWFVPADYECPEDAPSYNYDGLFRDDDGNIHEPDIDFIGAAAVTRGCNPPFNDEFCPAAGVTRGQMAAFLDRALDLPPTAEDFFADDTGSIFEEQINRLAAAGITLGCNPPENNEFCPLAKVTRGQMAAFLVRGFALTAGAGADLFIDDDGSVFETVIDILGTSGVTRGCNPPDNDRFCPNATVTRAQMASFLARALTLDGN